MLRITALTILLATTTAMAKPNIIFILADDMGWTGSSVQMDQSRTDSKSDFYQTPTLEKLAEQGMRFSRAYSPGSLCTPSRAAILTGKTPAELHMTTPGGGRTQFYQKLAAPTHIKDLPLSEVTLAEQLQKAGYATAHFGKWHLGQGNPGEHGFDQHDGSTANECNGSESDPKEIFSITERALQFIEEKTQAGKPFYLQLSHYAVHSPVEAQTSSTEKFETLPAGEQHNNAEFAAMTYDLDTSIGTLLEKVDPLENTYVVFMSDNGAPGNPRNPENTPLSGGKSSLYEGGIREPLIIRGPGIAPNTFCKTNVTGSDLFPTFCDWAKIDPGKIEGSSLIPLLTGNPAAFQRENALLFHYPHYGQGPRQKPQSALISGNYKIIQDLETASIQLFNLETDIGEQNDLSKKMQGKTEEMERLMEQRLKAVDAQLPSPNPDYDPAAQTTTRRNRR